MIVAPRISPDATQSAINGMSQMNLGDDMSSEMNRLITFNAWPATFPTPSMLSCAGFYYTGVRDVCKCFSCNNQVSSWTPDMIPHEIHKQRYPQCLLVMVSENRNRPILPSKDVMARVAQYFNKKDPNVGFLSMKEGIMSFPSIRGMTNPNVRKMNMANNHLTGVVSAQAAQPSNTLDRQILSRNPTGLSLQGPAQGPGGAMGGGLAGYQPPPRRIGVPGEGTVISDPPQFLPNQAQLADMKNEQARLLTLQSWPKREIIQPSELAKAGFFYVGPMDRVQCAFCRGKLEGWVRGDQPLAEHRKHFGNRCRFIQNDGIGVGNIPVGGDQSATLQASSGPSSLSGPLSSGQPRREAPKFPTYAIPVSREATYATWPRNSPMSSAILSRAGFFYTGNDDTVKCFHCGNMLNDWRESDDPWIEHAHWFSHCGYVRQVKGEEFIQMAVNNYSDILNAGGHRRSALQPPRPSQTANTTTSEGALSAEAIIASPVAQQVVQEGIVTREDVQKAARVLASRNTTTMPDANTLVELALNLRDATLQAGNVPTSEPQVTSGETQGASAGSLSQVEGHSFNEENENEPTEGSSTTKSSKNARKREKKRRQKAEAAAAAAASGSETPNESEAGNPAAASDPPEGEEQGEEKVSSLMREYAQMQEQRTCKVCFDEEINVVFLPCGHMVCCALCAPALIKCPVCRGSISDVVRTYLS